MADGDFFVILIAVVVLLFLALLIINEYIKDKQTEHGNKLNSIEQSIPDFCITQKCRDELNEFEIAIDASQRKFCYIERKTGAYTIYSYDDVISVDLVKDDASISSKSVIGTVGRAAVGGAIAGGIGAFIGGTTSKTITSGGFYTLIVKVHLRSIENPVLDIVFADGSELADGEVARICMKNAHSFMDIFSVIVDDANRKLSNEQQKILSVPVHSKEQSYSIADRLIEYANLKTKGIISEEEFQTLKTKLLS